MYKTASWAALLVFVLHSLGFGKDYLLTLGGGYAPSGNQASLEANVLFFQEVVRVRHPSPTQHQIFFADGFDDNEDLQTLAPKPKAISSAIELLNNVFDLDRERVLYRDHRVPDIHGALNPSAIRMGLEELAKNLTDRDRLIIYVTAHGSAGKGKDLFNTSITCWDKKSLSMKTFSEWLDQVPESVPVVMIMAQCYCGGFANTIFADGDPVSGLAHGLRVGFFAQRHDLPAAGCRPDIENDEEYSSYFWGAFMGRSRTGKIIENVDCNDDGRISFAEAHAYAVVASQTIDIPLKSTETFLRQFSRIAGYETTRPLSVDETGQSNPKESDLFYLAGTVDEISLLGTPEQRRMVIGLTKRLDIPLSSDVSEVFLLSEKQHQLFRQTRRSGRRGRGSSRRNLRTEIIAQWPELEVTERWSTLEFLKPNTSEVFLDQLRELPSYAAYQKNQEDRLKASETAMEVELQDVLFRRLIHSLETIVYAQNLPFVASPEEIQKYQSMIAIEESFLDR